ncbi:hypothetical protein [Pseudobutyrivibrio ruminis]|uniref:hypothetical protein n=1 Tax=Pseudobutyrivibrio ruminis TaxID=46206 RepID=UPI00051C14FD|nr:hypothetical protein [Pseudobutyrivibrio ruminis]
MMLVFPCVYSIYYSVPASDDFAMALGRDAYANGIIEFFNAIPFFFMKRGGTMVAFVFELLLNPLNLHVHLGHAYGLYMIAAFLLCMAAVLYGVKAVVVYTIRNHSNLDLIASVITFLVAIMLIENYYYVEAYSWFVGMVAYPMNVAFMFIAAACIIRFGNTGEKKYYIWAIITGTLAANTTALDIPLGIFFLYVVSIRKEFDKHFSHNVFKKYLPLIFYIIAGLIAVAAPGNFARQSQYTESVSAGNSIIQTIADVKFFGMAIITERPVTIIILAVLIIVGVAISAGKNIKPGNIILYGLASVCIWLGCLLPYVYGRGMTRTYLDVRMQYVFDFLFEITICIGAVILGQWIGYFVKTNFEKLGYVVAGGVAVLGACALIITGRYATTVSYEVYVKRAEIAASYDLWNGILLEIEQSDSDDVVVNRDYNIPWNKYFLYSGMEPGEVYAVDLDAFYDSQQILPNVYYKKNSITVNYPR